MVTVITYECYLLLTERLVSRRRVRRVKAVANASHVHADKSKPPSRPAPTLSDRDRRHLKEMAKERLAGTDVQEEMNKGLFARPAGGERGHGADRSLL